MNKKDIVTLVIFAIIMLFIAYLGILDTWWRS